MPDSFSAESFFASQSPPPRLPEELAAVREFVDLHAKEGRRVVLVTVSLTSCAGSGAQVSELMGWFLAEWRDDGAARTQCVSTRSGTNRSIKS